MITPDDIPSGSDSSEFNGPEFKEPKTPFINRVSMKLAGVALGVGAKADPSEVLSTLATRVGGYIPTVDPNKPGSVRFTNKDREPKFLDTLSDSSTKASRQRDYRNADDFREETGGIDLTSAALRTAKGTRTAPRRLTAREKAAKSFAKRGLRGGNYRHVSPADITHS